MGRNVCDGREGDGANRSRMPGQAGNKRGPLPLPSDDRLSEVCGDRADRELGHREVRYADVPPCRVEPRAPVTRHGNARRQSLRPPRESQAQGAAADARIEHVALVSEGEAARIEAGVDLPQFPARAGIRDR